MLITWETTKKAIYKDVYRNIGICNKKIIFRESLRYGSTTGVLVFYRMCQFFAKKEHKNVIEKVLYVLCYLMFKRKQIVCGIELNQNTRIGAGLRLPHRGGIVIHPLACVGENCEIMQGVTIGNNIMKSREGVATIGDRVLICSGTKIIGNVKIGNDVVIGANSIVNKDVSEGDIVGGVPVRVLGKSSSVYLINI